MIKGLAAAGRALALAVTSAWVLALVLDIGRGRSASALVLGQGVRALYGLVLLASLAPLVAAFYRFGRWPGADPGASLARRAWVPTGTAVGLCLAGPVVLAPLGLAHVAELLLPQRLDLRASFVSVGAGVLAAGIAVVAAWLVMKKVRRWPVVVALVAWELSGRHALELVVTGRQHWLELGNLLAFTLLTAPLRPPTVPAATESRLLPGLRTAGMGLLLASAGVMAFLMERRPLVAATFASECPGAASLVKIARNLYDLDGDGFSSVLGGGDCDDGDPAISPRAVEIVANGRDDNCIGGDPAGWSGRGEATRSPSPPSRSIVLISIDALRADVVEPLHMPSVSSWAQRGTWFTRAYAPASMTDYSVRSLMTGYLPMDYSDGELFFGQEPSIAEYLADVGYATSAIITVWQLNPYASIGFDRIDESLASQHRDFKGQTARQVTELALAELDRLGPSGGGERPRPFFLWVHYFDPHSDYLPVPEAPDFGPGDRGRYLQEVWATDREVGRFLSGLESRGFVDEGGVVALLADHGELLGDDGRLGHSFWMDEEVLRVPLVLRARDLPQGRFQPRVRLVDFAATILPLAAAIRAPSDGESLEAVWRGVETGDRDVFAVSQYHGSDVRAALVGDWKLVRNVPASTEYLFNLQRDPEEEENLLDDEAESLREMRAALGRRWDMSLNDRALTRKLRQLSRRSKLQEEYNRFLQAKLAEQCRAGSADDCRKLAEVRAGTGAEPQ